MSGALHEITIAGANRAFAARKLSPVELTKAYLARIAEIDSTLHSYLLVTGDRALAEAAQAEAEIMRDGPRGPMHGVPYGLKDIYETKGLRTTAHSKLLEEYIPAEDCTAQKKLRAAGGVLLGKQATWEFALGGPSFDLPWPPARNPWDLSRSPSGSSSGAGASIAAGLCAGAMGSDTGGSIRMPAAACGIAGLKPTYGLVSRKGVLPNSFSFDHCGPMAWTVEDVALMLQVVAGYDPADPGSADAPAVDYAAALTRSVKGLKVGVVSAWYEEEVRAAPAVIAAMDESIRTFEALGCAVKRITLPTLRDFTDAKTPITLTEIYTIHENDLRTRPQDFGRSLRYRIMPGGLLRAEDYVQGMRWRNELTAMTLEAMRGFDVIITAGAFEPATPIAEENPPVVIGAKTPSLTSPFNLTGMPALTVCNGFMASGLPVGMQIAGRPFDDATVLAVGHAFETTTGFRSKRPVVKPQQAAQ